MPFGHLAGQQFDFFDSRMENLVRIWIGQGFVWFVHFGIPCARWSRARTTGGGAGGETDRLGLAAVRFTIRIMKLCRGRDVFVSIENPSSSGLWNHPPLARGLQLSGAIPAKYHCCAYIWGPISEAHHLLVQLAELHLLARRCQCCAPHEHLSSLAQFTDADGRSRSVFKTSLASKYPPGVRRQFARIAGYSAPPGAWRTGDELVLFADWERQLWRAADLAPGELLDLPRCGCLRRFTMGWETVTGFIWDNGSAERRRAALAALGLPRGRIPVRRQRWMRECIRAARRLRAVPKAEGRQDFLKWRTIGRVTQQQYMTAAQSFDDYLNRHGLQMLAQQDLDLVLDRYLTHFFFKGHTVQEARYAFYGVAFVRHVPTRASNVLPLAKKSLKGFNMASPENLCDPVPWQAICFVARRMTALRTRQHVDVDAAAAFVVIFDGCSSAPYRSASGWSTDVVTPQGGRDSRLSLYGHAPSPPPTIKRTKTGQQDDTILMGTPGAGRGWVPNLLNALRLRARRRRQGSRLFRVDLAQLRALLHKHSHSVDLAQLNMTPHCLRHGGPRTDRLLNARSLQDVQRRGRWLAMDSVRRHEKHGRFLCQLNRMSWTQRSAGDEANTGLESHLPKLVRECASS